MPLCGDRLKLTTTLRETLSAQRDALWPSPTVSQPDDVDFLIVFSLIFMIKYLFLIVISYSRFMIKTKKDVM